MSRNPTSFRSAKASVSFNNKQMLSSTFVKSKDIQAARNQNFETKSVCSNKTSSNVTKRITFANDKLNANNNDYNTANDTSMSQMIKNILMRQTKRVRSNQTTQRRRGNDMSYAVKEAQYYFEKNPTYLKEIEVGEVSKNLDLEKYVASIGIKRNPIFGFPLISYEEDISPDMKMEKQAKFSECLIGNSPFKGIQPKKIDFKNENIDSDNESNQGSKIKLPFRQALNQKRKDDRIFQHIMKCFTFGKKIKRQMEDDADKVSRVDILKKRFQRLSLLRDYFSVTKRDQPRKFKYPICEDAGQAGGRPLDIYDELQYCEESDVEECMRPSPGKKKMTMQEADLEEKSFSLDMDILESQEDRFDLKIMKNLTQKMGLNPKKLDEQEESVDSDTDTFKNLSDSNSLHSSPRHRTYDEMMACDRLMPFDFFTHRKAKGFFKEQIQDVDCLLQNYENSLKLKQQYTNIEKDKIAFDENEDAKLNELPERNEYLKQMYLVKAQPMDLVPNPKLRKALKKPSIGSQENTQAFEKFKYTEKVQANQVRNAYNDLKSLTFTRSQSKNLKQKRQILQKLVSFKQNISPLQIQALQARQFVIVDVAITPPQQQSPQKKRVREEDIFRGKDAEQIQIIKARILQQKDNMIKMAKEQQMRGTLSNIKSINLQNQKRLHSNNSQMLTAVSATPAVLRPQVSKELLRQTDSRNMLFQTPGQSSLSSIQPIYNISNRLTVDYIPEEQQPQKLPDMKADYQQFINDSPYVDILCPPHNFGIGNNGTQTIGKFKQQHRIRKFMAEKLKRRSILNCELFKETPENDSKAKTLQMTEKIGKILGLKIGNNSTQNPQQQQKRPVMQITQMVI